MTKSSDTLRSPADLIRDFVRSNITALAAGELRDDDDIFERGFVSSIFAMQLLDFVEQTFDLEIADEDITLANFRSVDAMTAVVDRAVAGDRR